MATITATHATEIPARPRDAVYPGEPIRLTVEPQEAGTYRYEWELPPEATTDSTPNRETMIVYFSEAFLGPQEISVSLFSVGTESSERIDGGTLTIEVLRLTSRVEERVGLDALVETPLPVGLRRSPIPFTPDVALWMVIRRSARALAFEAYGQAMDGILCGLPPTDEQVRAAGVAITSRFIDLERRRFLPFNDTDAYRYLKIATEAYLLANVGVPLGRIDAAGGIEVINPFSQREVNDAVDRLGGGRASITADAIGDYLRGVLQRNDSTSGAVPTLPYLALVRRKLRDAGVKRSFFAGLPGRIDGDDGLPEGCEGILEARLTSPLLLELIWSYWHEEGMLVQTMSTISRRFQNIRGPGDRDPLAGFETDPLRPLNNLLWGYVQDEQHRLTVLRRAYEYDHHYGISLVGKAVGTLRTADSRSKFLEGFHNLLYLCTLFYQQDDDTTVIADGFPLLNGLREVHLELSHGAHNQFGDLPSTARQEMLIQQWLLARPEFREFLPTRVMVAYPEPWMDRVDAMKGLQGWTNSSVLHFHTLGQFGEQLLLAIRYGAWTDPNITRDWAANWARFWRSEVQGYIHAYRAVTGVDLSADLTDSQRDSDRALQPSVLLSRQLESQRRGALPAPAVAPQLPARRKLPTR
jgi:hypothetical protein